MSIKHLCEISTGSSTARALNTIISDFRPITRYISQYLANDTRYRHSYYRKRIGTRTQAFEWHKFQWPWMTCNPDFKVTILFNVEYLQKWYKLEIYLQFLTNSTCACACTPSTCNCTWTSSNRKPCSLSTVSVWWITMNIVRFRFTSLRDFGRLTLEPSYVTETIHMHEPWAGQWASSHMSCARQSSRLTYVPPKN